MSSLSYCLKKAGARISRGEIKVLRTAVAKYRTEGIAGHEANLGAVQDVISDLNDDLKSIVSQVGWTPPTVAAAPAPRELIPAGEIPFNLAGEVQPEAQSAIAIATENAARDAAVKAEQDRQSEMFATEAPQGWRSVVAQAGAVMAKADRANQFAAVVARLRQTGAQVDVFARVFLQAKMFDIYQKRLGEMIERYKVTPEAEQPALQQRIELVQERMASMDRITGVTYSADHIALGLEDIHSASLEDLITLMHEAGHMLLNGDPVMRSRVLRAVQKLAIDLHGESRARTESTGVGEAKIADHEELLVHTFAQRLAEEGVPDSPSLARTIVQWIKDLYYRLAMAVQASFGREPNPQTALDWFENQLRRLTGGDYDYRFANLLERLAPEPTPMQAQRQNTIGGTPGNVADYYDSRTNSVRQPQVLPDSREAVQWNLKFMTSAGANPGEEFDIPYTEAAARIQGAAVNEMATLAEKLFAEAAGPVVEGQPRKTFDQWWALVGDGDTPKSVLEELEAKVPGSGTATIGGERMTDPMNQQARVWAKELLYHLRDRVVKHTVSTVESETRAERTLVAEAKRVNKIEGDLRNADMHAATFIDSFKEMVREAIKGVRRGLDTGFAAGELAQAIREAEGLAERDPIPAQYQAVFRSLLADELPVFQYLQAIAKLDLPLYEMTRKEIIAAVRENAAGDEVLGRLLSNRPLMVSLLALAKKNSQQMDLLQLRLVQEPEQYLKIKAEMDEIRTAGVERLKAMETAFRDGKKATTFADRIKRTMVETRAKLRRAQATIQESEESRNLLAKVSSGLSEKIDEMETGGMPAPSEWKPNDGAKYPAMYQDDEGKWHSRERTLGFTREGPAVNAAQVAAEMVINRQYLRENPEKAGSKTYQLVARVTDEMARLDIFQTYPELRRNFWEKWFLPPADRLLSGGGAGGARATQMLKRFQAITFRKWHSDVEIPALHFIDTWKRAAKSAGFDDIQHFWDQVVEPSLYLIQTEPGRDEGPALREAVRLARQHLTDDPNPQFDDNFKALLRSVKERSEFFLNQVAEKEGLFIADKRLGGELRRAVPRGWLTVIRRMNAAAIGTVSRDMDVAGWKVQFKDENGNPVGEGFEQAVARNRKVAGSASFDALFPDGTDEETDAAKIAVLEDPEAFAQAISGFFTPGIVRRWLAPFINKPGAPIFSYNGEAIDQLDVQAAWVESGGDIAKWIDELGRRVGLEIDAEPDEELQLGDMSLEAQWRMRVLKRLDSLFLMEARIAADAAQTRNLFDPSGRPAHLMMDARENELLPSEHVQHMTFDLVNSRNLLSTLAFHAAFGRNGEEMIKAIGEIKSGLVARKHAYQTVVASASTVRERKARAAQDGFDYDEIKRGAEIFDQVTSAMDLLKAQFGFGTPAGVLGDVRGALELLHFIATQTTNNPKTGLLNLLQPAQRALMRRSMGPAVMRDTAGTYGSIAYQFFGGVLEKFGLHILRSSEHAKLIGAMQGQGIGNVPFTEILGLAMGKRGEELPTAIKGMRAVNALQRRGFGGTVREFPRAQIVPFAENTMAGLGMTAAIANGTQEAIAVERIVKAAMDYFTSHPDDAANPAFRLTPAALGMDNLGWFGDRGSFDYFVRKLPEYGLGTLENMARTGLDRATRAEPILDNEQTALAALISNNELDLVGSINTNPAAWGTNSFVKFATPLLGWPIRQMNAVHQSMREADGRYSALAMMRAIGILAAWSLPMGLAFTFLTDEFDDKILKKKSNMGRLSPIAGIPVVGPALSLATSDVPALEQGRSMLQRISKAGNIYGLGADFVSSVLSGLDPTSGARPFSLDSRILAFSQLRTMADAFSSMINTGGAITWSTVERPLLSAMGGNGALSAIDIFNAALGLDNDQSRLVARTNLQQWLRVAGRETGLELRRSGGASVAPTPVSVWVREMGFASLANDRLGFLENYRRAVDAAREEGSEDPEKRVLESWKARDPLDVFKTKPTDAQLSRMLSIMNDSGRQVVRDGLRLFEQFTNLIEPSIAERYQRQQLGQMQRMGAPNVEAIRRQMAGQSLSFR